jgi:hypothetical protein
MYQDRFDDGEWTYACRFTPEGDSDADYAQHVRGMKEVAVRAESASQRLAILICQEPGFPAPNSGWRKKVAEMTASPSFRPIHCAIVTRNPLIRGVVTALNWLRKREYSEDIFGDIEAALGWLEAGRGHLLPALRATVRGWGSDSPWAAVEDRMRSVAARSARIVERHSGRPPRRRP